MKKFIFLPFLMIPIAFTSETPHSMGGIFSPNQNYKTHVTSQNTNIASSLKYDRSYPVQAAPIRKIWDESEDEEVCDNTSTSTIVSEQEYPSQHSSDEKELSKEKTDSTANTSSPKYPSSFLNTFVSKPMDDSSQSSSENKILPPLKSLNSDSTSHEEIILTSEKKSDFSSKTKETPNRPSTPIPTAPSCEFGIFNNPSTHTHKTITPSISPAITFKAPTPKKINQPIEPNYELIKAGSQSLINIDFFKIPKIKHEYGIDFKTISALKFIEECCINAPKILEISVYYYTTNKILDAITEIASISIGKKLLSILINKKLLFSIDEGILNYVDFIQHPKIGNYYNIKLGSNAFLKLSKEFSEQNPKFPSPGTFLFRALLECLHRNDMPSEKYEAYAKQQIVTRQLFIQESPDSPKIIKVFDIKKTEIPEGQLTLSNFNDKYTHERFGIVGVKIGTDEYIHFDEINESTFLGDLCGTALAPAASNFLINEISSTMLRPTPLNFNLLTILMIRENT